jgi:hypothetical protein
MNYNKKKGVDDVRDGAGKIQGSTLEGSWLLRLSPAGCGWSATSLRLPAGKHGTKAGQRVRQGFHETAPRGCRLLHFPVTENQRHDGRYQMETHHGEKKVAACATSCLLAEQEGVALDGDVHGILLVIKDMVDRGLAMDGMAFLQQCSNLDTKAGLSTGYRRGHSKR